MAVARPDSPDANFQSTPLILDAPIIPITYTLSDPEEDRVRFVRAWYSQDGGGNWQRAVAAAGTITTNLVTSSEGRNYTYDWDVLASGFFGLSDNVVFRLEAYTDLKPAYTDLKPYTSTVPGPYQHPYASATTFPFRVRGTQVQVCRDAVQPCNEAAGATVYRLPKEGSRDAQPMGNGGIPYRTDSHGYLQGRGKLQTDDRLVALLPVTSTDIYTLYYTSAAPNLSGLTTYTVTASGVQTLDGERQQPARAVRPERGAGVGCQPG